MNALTIVLFEHLLIVMGVGIALFLKFRWRIPVIILRYVGDKRRPLVIVTKGRKQGVGWMGAVKRLYIKGYRHPLKDYKAENYYPSLKGGQGALLLWEFKPGWLTPVLPTKVMQSLTPEERAKLDVAFSFVKEKSVMQFDMDEDLYARLVGKVIDDVDAEYFLREQQRQDSQYTGGIKDFLTKNGPWIAMIFIAGIILVGYIVYLDRVPSVAEQCIQSGVEAAKNTYLKDIASQAAGGVPLG